MAFVFDRHTFCLNEMLSAGQFLQQQQQQQQQQQLHLQASMLPSTTKAARSGDRTSTCQVPGCRADLVEEKLYCLRKRICSRHMQATSLQCGGQHFRYCFQCAKLEPLTNFDGHKRSCRRALNKRKLRTSAAPARGNTSFSSAPATPSALQLQLQQQTQLLQLQQQQLQQQQQLIAPAPVMQQQLAAAAHTLSEAYTMAERVASMLVATRAQTRPQANTAAEVSQMQLLLQQQQQQLCPPAHMAAAAAALGAGPLGFTSPFAESHAVAAAAVRQDGRLPVPAAATAATAATAAADREFDSFLETLLDPSPTASSSGDEEGIDDDDDNTPDTRMVSDPSCSSASVSGTPAPSFPPHFSGQPLPMPTAGLAGAAAAGGCLPLLPTAASYTGPLPAAAPAGPAAAAGGMGKRGSGSKAQHSAGATTIPMPGCAAAAAAAAAGVAVNESAVLPASGGVGAGVPLLPLNNSSCSTGGAAAAAAAAPLSAAAGGLAGLQGHMSTSEQLQCLNAMLQQLQSSVMALAANMQNSAATEAGASQGGVPAM